MWQVAGTVVFLAAQLGGLLMIPFGLPGTWLQVVAVLAMTFMSDGALLGWGWVAAFVLLAAFGELVEFASGQWGARRFGGSPAAAWGAFLGGLVGAVVGGVPVPVVGSVVASFAGSVVGAMLGEMYRRRRLTPDLRIGAGALLGRAIGIGTKTFVGFLMAITSGAVVIAQLWRS
jgi:uncharacterized protein YqgC (DUF456 family)